VRQRQRQKPVSVAGFLEAFALGGAGVGFVGVFAPFGQEVVVIARVVAEDDAGGGEMENCGATADG
jgi:hypothetical protein